MSIPSVRSRLGGSRAYYAINREERNLAAILYAALLNPSNLKRFLSLIKSKLPQREQESAVYFEYAYLRDLWQAAGDDEAAQEAKRNAILDALEPPNRKELQAETIADFNAFFGAGPRASSKYIQSPGTWSISRFKDTIRDNGPFLKTCMFKWAFNAKPDIVIHTTPDTAVCIEAKFESGEGSYPTAPAEIEEFNRRGIQLVGQTTLQKYLMEELLGIRAEFVFLVQSPRAKSPTHQVLLWRNVFEVLDLVEMPAFVRAWIKRL